MESSISGQLKVVEASSGQNVEAVVSLLRMIRSAGVRLPATVVRWGVKAMAKPGKCGDEIWSVYEQVLIAALDVGDAGLAHECYEALSSRFESKSGSTSSSARVGRLRGMVLESRGAWADAAKTYDDLLEHNGANGAALKRLVCVAKSKAEGNDAKTATALGEYLDQFQSDKAAWQELAALHANRHDTDRAIFCYEELTLFEPAAPHWHCRLAELYCGKDDKTARKYFAQSLELSKVRGVVRHNARAAFGLLQVCRALAVVDPADALNVALGALAGTHLKTLYTRNAPPGVDDLVANFVADKAPPYPSPSSNSASPPNKHAVAPATGTGAPTSSSSSSG